MKTMCSCMPFSPSGGQPHGVGSRMPVLIDAAWLSDRELTGFIS